MESSGLDESICIPWLFFPGGNISNNSRTNQNQDIDPLYDYVMTYGNRIWNRGNIESTFVPILGTIRSVGGF